MKTGKEIAQEAMSIKNEKVKSIAGLFKAKGWYEAAFIQTQYALSVKTVRFAGKDQQKLRFYFDIGDMDAGSILKNYYDGTGKVIAKDFVSAIYELQKLVSAERNK